MEKRLDVLRHSTFVCTFRNDVKPTYRSYNFVLCFLNQKFKMKQISCQQPAARRQSSALAISERGPVITGVHLPGNRGCSRSTEGKFATEEPAHVGLELPARAAEALA